MGCFLKSVVVGAQGLHVPARVKGKAGGTLDDEKN